MNKHISTQTCLVISLMYVTHLCCHSHINPVNDVHVHVHVHLHVHVHVHVCTHLQIVPTGHSLHSPCPCSV